MKQEEREGKLGRGRSRSRCLAASGSAGRMGNEQGKRPEEAKGPKVSMIPPSSLKTERYKV